MSRLRRVRLCLVVAVMMSGSLAAAGCAGSNQAGATEATTLDLGHYLALVVGIERPRVGASDTSDAPTSVEEGSSGAAEPGLADPRRAQPATGDSPWVGVFGPPPAAAGDEHCDHCGAVLIEDAPVCITCLRANP